ncbi:uncharacterized protein ASCRUDRAFT_72196 [Ascoidea rubescens DSM 1968]|uniref:U1-type domain-containing protein n=1 Tax=Ascoidea rubescens DSM 1968 TaxID=1344418 RepID=A0A1D2VAU6_9ASCO|nr:hypothetical protein ASCRUDRAFT_72196 [Ascoidea rubescens DSM 1968]ODV58782.1 hypothetical protein ASCRUDRAFT_72196 [Ascoidea rubescens DSM 1968]
MGKYWCKNCKIFVDDSKLQRRNHELSNKHQRNIQKLISDLHLKNIKEHKINKPKTCRIEKSENKNAIKIKIDKELKSSTKSHANEEKVKEAVIGAWEEVQSTRERENKKGDGSEDVAGDGAPDASFVLQDSAKSLDELANWDLTVNRKITLATVGKEAPNVAPLFKKRKTRSRTRK